VGIALSKFRTYKIHFIRLAARLATTVSVHVVTRSYSIDKLAVCVSNTEDPVENYTVLVHPGKLRTSTSSETTCSDQYVETTASGKSPQVDHWAEGITLLIEPHD
jgi:hypothetical protein